MAIDERLRHGLATNTEHLVTDLELDLARVLGRAHRRHQARMAGGVALLAAAAVAAVAWIAGVPGLDRAEKHQGPIKHPKVVVAEPRSMDGIDGPLEAGQWIMPTWGKDTDGLPRVVLDVPEGYGSTGGWVVDRGADGDPENYGSVSVWTVDAVYRDPCEGTAVRDPGPGVRDLAMALHAQRRVASSAPTPITFDGHSGLYLEVRFPNDQSRLLGCRESAYKLWRTDVGDYYRTDQAGTVSRLWILDVDGTRVVLVADTTPREDAAATAEVLGIAASAHFLEPLKPAR
jgi:hypothetical protein